MRFTGGPGATAAAGLAASVVGNSDAAVAVAELSGSEIIVCDSDRSLGRTEGCAGRETETTPAGFAISVETGGFVSGDVFLNAATPAAEPEAGGLTMTGPEGGRAAMAGAGGAVVTICGACRGWGTILRGPAACVALPDAESTWAALAPGLVAGEEVAAVGAAAFGAGAAALSEEATLGRCCAVGGAPRWASRCSFCC